MDFPTFAATFFVVAAVFAMRTYFKAFWDRIRLPFLVVMSVLSAAVVSMLLYAAHTMLHRTIYSAGEKILYCFVIVGFIGFFAWLNISNWKEWRDRRRDRK